LKDEYIIAGIGLAGIAAYLYFRSSNCGCIGQTPPTCCGGCTGTTLTYDDLVALAQTAGFGCDSGTAAAVALAESSGRTAVLGDQSLAPCNGPAVGLWQINSAKHAEYTIAQLQDPATNAAEAFAVYQKAGGFHPWTTYNNGKYLTYVPACAPTCAPASCAPACG